MKKLFILSGPSGSGVSSSKFVFGDLGYFVIDNAPSAVTKPILDECAANTYAKGFCLMPRIDGVHEVVDTAKEDSSSVFILIILMVVIQQRQSLQVEDCYYDRS